MSNYLVLEPQPYNPNKCGMCGGAMVSIRGRYPKDEKRKICPTCTYERLEQIHEMSSPNYGKAYQVNTPKEG